MAETRTCGRKASTFLLSVRVQASSRRAEARARIRARARVWVRVRVRGSGCVDVPRDDGHVREQQRHVRREQAEVRAEGVEARRVVGHVLDQLGQPRLVLGVEQQLVRVSVRVRVS